jgi:hypothetical protein
MKATLGKMRQAWKVCRHGLPVIEVFYRKIRVGSSTLVLRTEFDYEGDVKHLDECGQLLQSHNGTFAIEQKVDVSVR